MPALDGGDEPISRLDGVADTRSDQPGEELTRTELLRLLAQRMGEQEYRIVYLKYWEDLSMREIGELTGISESRVCKIHAKLLERLKDRFRAQGSELNG
jgi:RNA polymerase sigma factor for flagellar operon FliA